MNFEYHHMTTGEMTYDRAEAKAWFEEDGQVERQGIDARGGRLAWQPCLPEDFEDRGHAWSPAAADGGVHCQLCGRRWSRGERYATCHARGGVA